MKTISHKQKKGEGGMQEKLAFDIIVIAGQSNAEGYGIIKEGDPFRSEFIYQVSDKNPAFLNTEDENHPFLEATYPTKAVLEPVHERVDAKGVRHADLSWSFANAYIADGNLAEDRKVLIVKAAVGGTGFARKEWGVDSLLFKRLNAMIDFGLDLHENNRIVAFLWHQGEHDAVENTQLSLEERYTFYFDNFKKQMDVFREKYGKDIPVIAGEFADNWAELPENKEKCDTVEKALKDVCREIGRAAVAESTGLLSNDQALQNGDILHFCEEAQYILGRRYYEKYKEKASVE